MVDRHLLREFSVDDAELEAVMDASFDMLEDVINEEAQTYDINDILVGTVVRVDDEEVVVDGDGQADAVEGDVALGLAVPVVVGVVHRVQRRALQVDLE